MTSVSSANKEQSLTEKEKKVERDNAWKLAHALGIDMTVLNNSMALRCRYICSVKIEGRDR